MTRTRQISTGILAAASILSITGLAQAALPPVPVPPANPITEPKRVLGKILFWDEQLSVDGTMACATCHTFNRGGTDARRVRTNGPDGIANTPDDIFASPGVIKSDSFKDFVRDVTFGTTRQVTGRASVSPINAAYATDLFWDGRARSTFTNPETGQVSIQQNGALESQIIGPIQNSVEMAHDGVSWAEVETRLASVRPLALATNFPTDVANVLASRPGYPELFSAAFGSGAITADRIAKAIATYERTLISDQTPFDLGTLTPNQQQGLNLMGPPPGGHNCVACHVPPLFTGNGFRNIGLRPPTEDTGRQIVTGDPADRGKFKVPSLRNVALQTTFMHNGMFTTLPQVFGFYDRAPGVVQFTDNQDPIMAGVRLPPQDGALVQDFLANGLVDPRVRNETFPFDHPTLFTARPADQPVLLGGGVAGTGAIVPQIIAISPPMIGNADFRVGLDRALGGATARLALSSTAPVNGKITPTQTMTTKLAGGAGAGNGLATEHLSLTGPGFVSGQTMYAQWIVDDPAALGGQAFSTVASFRLFCGSEGCQPLCAADMDNNGSLSVQDIFSFISAWFASDPRTDFDHSGTIEVQDIFTFLGAWFGGC
jgi:cytochrome c peroxidase